MLAFLKDIIQLMFLVGGMCVAVFIFLHLAPRIQFAVSHWWPADGTNTCILKVAITNTSRIRVRKDCVSLKVEHHTMTELPDLTEWVEFDESSVAIFKTTDFLYPGETISIERPVVFPEDKPIAHVGVQFRASLSKFDAWINRVSGRAEQWTTTFFLASSGTRDTNVNCQPVT